MRIDHVAIGADELEPTVNWYRDVIGLRELGADGARQYMGCGGRAGYDLSIEPGGPGMRYVAYSCYGDEQFDDAVARLGESGLPEAVVDYMGPGVVDAMAAELPSGHVVQVVKRDGTDHYLSVAAWAPDAPCSPRELDHVNIAARDVGAAVAALGRSLDLALSDLHVVDGPGTVGAWMRAGERHHDFAIIKNRGDGLHHVAYQLADPGAVIAAADRLASAGTTAEYGVGRHAPGSNVFLYVRDPSGNRVELCADMALVPAGAPHRVWEGKDVSIINTLAPYGPPKSFWEIT